MQADSGKKKNDALKAFLHFISTNEDTDEFTKLLVEKVEKIKRNETFRSEYMKMNIAFLDAIREGRKAGVQEGLKQGRNEDKIEISKKLILMGLPIEKIAEATSLSVEKIEELIKELQ